MADKYSYAINPGDAFQGEYSTREEAAAAAFADYDASPDVWKESCPLLCITTGRNRLPDVLGYLTGELVIDLMQQSPDCDELAADWPNATSGQVVDLTARLRATVAEWLKACNLEPTWGAVDLIEYHYRPETNKEGKSK